MIGRPRCRQCGCYRATRVVQRFGGESHWRGGAWRPASICEDCARNLLRGVSDDRGKTDRWSVRGLRAAWKIKES